jgi:hypothetical protein
LRDTIATASEWLAHSRQKLANMSCRFGPSTGLITMEAVMDKIAKANVIRFNALLEAETDPKKRIMIARLLAEEKVKLSPPKPRQKNADDTQ